jgi:hypothetical protein
MNARTATSLALFCSGVLSVGTMAGCGAPEESNLHQVSTMKYDLRPEMNPDTPWGGWTDGTSYYLIGKTTPDGGTEVWGAQSVLTIEPPLDDPEFDNTSFQQMATAKELPPGVVLNAVLHAKGQGYTNSGATIGYDVNGAGEDLSVYAEGGVVFFAKAGVDPNAPSVISLGLGSPDFSPLPAKPVGSPPDTSAHCGNPGYNGCYDGPTVSVQLRPFWRQFIIPFRAMRQQGYGFAVPDFYTARGLRKDPVSNNGARVSFGLPKNAPFDFWFAGFGFYMKAEHDKVFEY